MQRGVLVLAILATLCLFGELLGGISFFFQTGGFIYLPRESVRAAEFRTPAKYKQRLHPYFGFTGQYFSDGGQYFSDSDELYTNSLGFRQRESLEIPVTRGTTDFVVVVLGGSVAEHVAVGPYGFTLRDKLRTLPSLAGKNIILINMAQGSGKQPQQLFELAYLLAIGQKIDLVINIDGFNEFALAYQNHTAGLNPVLPSVQIIKPLALELSPGPEAAQYYDLASRILTTKQAVNEHATSLRQARTGLSFLKASILVNWNRMTLAKSISEYESLIVRERDWSIIKARFGLDLPNSGNVFETAFELWLRCSQQIKKLSETNGTAYLHVIQPNQYHSKHQFSDHERKIAFLPGHEYRVGVEGGYPLFVERKLLLEANGIVSAIDLFDSETEEVYSDNCCHYTRKGLNLFMRFIVDNVEGRLH